MSLGRRFINLVRANLNALMDRTADEPRLEDLSDEELEAELERRRTRRRTEEELRRAAQAAAQSARERTSTRRAAGRTATGSRGAPPRSGTRAGGTSERVARLYAVLETPVGADLETVKKNYRRLMRQYHPDVNAGSPERLRMANERSRILTQAFDELERHLLAR